MLLLVYIHTGQFKLRPSKKFYSWHVISNIRIYRIIINW
jgi:hypothetical protein